MGFLFLSHDAYGAPLGGPSGRRSSATIRGTILNGLGWYLLIGLKSALHQYLKAIIILWALKKSWNQVLMSKEAELSFTLNQISPIQRLKKKNSRWLKITRAWRLNILHACVNMAWIYILVDNNIDKVAWLHLTQGFQKLLRYIKNVLICRIFRAKTN